MIYAYGITQRGLYHANKGTVCQDAHRYEKCSDGMCIAAVADGLGSEEYSDIASRIAVDVCVEHCKAIINEHSSDDDVLAAAKASFALAQARIEAEAENADRPLDQYDTTLSLAILICGTLYYGHSGDSGIIALTDEGRYEKVTKQQRDDEGRVFPLYFGAEKWVFGKWESKVSSVLLATDGVYELFFPVYIRNEEVSIYVALARYFMDPDILHIARDGEDAVCERIGKFLGGIPENQLNDDKTLLVVMDTDVIAIKQPEEYYAEPDWDRLKEQYKQKWLKEAYPDLYDADGKPRTNTASKNGKEL